MAGLGGGELGAAGDEGGDGDASGSGGSGGKVVCSAGTSISVSVRCTS